MKKTKKVLVSGVFNILHPGHLRIFRFAKECGDHLIIVVEGDDIAGSAAHIPANLRLEGVLNNSLVNEAFITNEPIVHIIDRLRPDIVVKGKEHENTINPEVVILEKYGGRLLFSSGETLFSSLDLIRKEFQALDTQAISLPTEFLGRHNIEKSKLISLISKFRGVKICVVGDLIIDEYITCDPLGMSQEDPTIVVTPVDSTRFLGGAGIVAAHAAGLGAEVNFISIAGVDEAHKFALKKLESAGVHSHLLQDDSRPTTLKQRFRSKGKTLLRVSHLHQSPISAELQIQILALIKQNLEHSHALIFSDFNYGCLPQEMVEKIIDFAKHRKLFIAADSQSSSQMGDIGRFKGMDLITPTEREARISTRNRDDGLVVLGERLRKQALARNILLKLGEEGLLIHAHNGKNEGWLTDRVDALNGSAKDVAGAGDSLLVAATMSLVCGGDIWEAACLGSLAAALQVGRVGNTPLNANELLRELI